MAHGSILNKETDISNLLPLDGSKAMTGALAMGNHKITGLSKGTTSTDAATYGQLTSVSISASRITGTLSTSNIPNLNASKITSGTFATARIPNLAASKITSGILPVARGGTGVDNLDELKNILSNDIVSTRTWTANPADGLYNRDTIISNGENILSSNKILPFAFSVVFDYPSTTNWIGYKNPDSYYIYDNGTGHLWGLCYYIYEDSGREPNKIILSFPTSTISDTDINGGTVLHISTNWTNDDRLELNEGLLASSGNSHLCTFKFYYLNF